MSFPLAYPREAIDDSPYGVIAALAIARLHPARYTGKPTSTVATIRHGDVPVIDEQFTAMSLRESVEALVRLYYPTARVSIISTPSPRTKKGKHPFSFTLTVTIGPKERS